MPRDDVLKYKGSTIMNDKPEDLNKPVEANKTVTIIVNGVEKEVTARSELSFDDLIWLAFNEKPGKPNIEFSITYTKAEGSQNESSLTPGKSVKVVNGMIFDVDRTDRS